MPTHRAKMRPCSYGVCTGREGASSRPTCSRVCGGCPRRTDVRLARWGAVVMLRAPEPERVVTLVQNQRMKVTFGAPLSAPQGLQAGKSDFVRKVRHISTVNTLHSDVSDRAHVELAGRAFRIDIGQGTTGHLCRPPGWFPKRSVPARRS